MQKQCKYRRTHSIADDRADSSEHYPFSVLIQPCVKIILEYKDKNQYRDAIHAFDKGDFNLFLDCFFKAIHSRYDIENPIPKRYIRRKLNIINKQKEEINSLKTERDERNKILKRLAAEYTLLGKECEQEHMNDAAIRNYQKALEVFPQASEASRRLKKLTKK